MPVLLHLAPLMTEITNETIALSQRSVPASNNADLVTNSLDFALISHAVIIFADAGIAISTGVSSAFLWVLAKPFSVPVSLPFAPIRRTKEESTVEIERKRKAPASGKATKHTNCRVLEQPPASARRACAEWNTLAVSDLRSIDSHPLDCLNNDLQSVRHCRRNSGNSSFASSAYGNGVLVQCWMRIKHFRCPFPSCLRPYEEQRKNPLRKSNGKEKHQLQEEQPSTRTAKCWNSHQHRRATRCNPAATLERAHAKWASAEGPVP